MKNAIKREQSQARLSYAEREHFGASLKKYTKPATKVVAIKQQQFICTSEFQMQIFDENLYTTEQQW